MSGRLKVLFVCGRNQKRSPTAANIFRDDPRMEVRSAGVSESSRRPIRRSDLEWADIVIAMERKHVQRIEALFQEAAHNCVHLAIPDEYEFMDEDLIELLQYGVEELLAEAR